MTEAEQRVTARRVAAARLPPTSPPALGPATARLLGRPREVHRQGLAAAFGALSWWLGATTIPSALLRRFEADGAAARAGDLLGQVRTAAAAGAWARVWATALADVTQIPQRRVSMTSPRVYAAHMADEALRPLLEYSSTCILKGQPLTPAALVQLYEVAMEATEGDVWYTDESTLLGITNEAVLGRLVTRLTRDWPITVTPHFASVVDTFLGPALDARGVVRPQAWPCLYVLQERGTETIWDHLERVMRERDTARALRHASALLFAVVHAVDGAHAMLGLSHGDLHMENVMVRPVDLDAFYADRPWAYQVRGERHRVRVVSDHRNVLVEIIDLGRGTLNVSRHHVVGDLRRFARFWRRESLAWASPEWAAYLATLTRILRLRVTGEDDNAHWEDQQTDYDALPADAVLAELYASPVLFGGSIPTQDLRQPAAVAAMSASRTVLVARVPPDMLSERAPKRPAEAETEEPSAPSPPKTRRQKRARVDAVLAAVRAGDLAVRHSS